VRNWRMVIGERESNGVIQIESIFPPTWSFLAPSNNIQHGAVLPEKIKEAIEKEIAHTATDTSLKDGKMGGK